MTIGYTAGFDADTKAIAKNAAALGCESRELPGKIFCYL